MRSVFLVYMLNDRNNYKWIHCFIFKDLAFLKNLPLRLKLRTLIVMYANLIPISAVESFISFPFTRDFLNLETFKIFYLLGVYLKNVYFCMIFIFVFFFERPMQIPIKIPTGLFRIKKLNILPLVIYMVHDNSFFGSTADIVIKKRNIWDF